jgi:hypothetical protein
MTVSNKSSAEPRPGQCGRHVGRPGVARLANALLCLLFPVLCTAGLSGAAAGQDRRHEVYFAEPVTGRKVSGYEVDLSLTDDGVRRFAIPGDCGELTRIIEHGGAYRGTIVNRRLWQKVESDCRYHAFLHRHPRDGLTDYVTSYDFMNARISDLPLARHCAIAAECQPQPPDGLGLLRQFPLAEPGDGPVSNERECVLEDGLFRGRLFMTPEGVRCSADPGRPSLRLVAVDYADVNGDRVLDAVLRFVPVGIGAMRLPISLPVTRFGPEEAFVVAE